MGIAWSFLLCRAAAPGGRAFGQAATVELIGDHIGSSPGPCAGVPRIGLIGVM
jgi:hypothetical protein